jgi:hypothetical protein
MAAHRKTAAVKVRKTMIMKAETKIRITTFTKAVAAIYPEKEAWAAGKEQIAGEGLVNLILRSEEKLRIKADGPLTVRKEMAARVEQVTAGKPILTIKRLIQEESASCFCIVLTTWYFL